MKNVTIIYGSTTGNTESVANTIKDNLTDSNVTLSDVRDANDEMVVNADLVLYGSSTWGYGDLQDDFDKYYNNNMISSLLSGKKVAVFGCGDNDSFEDVFCNATELIAEKAMEFGAKLVLDILKIDGYPEDNQDEILAFAQKISKLDV